MSGESIQRVFEEEREDDDEAWIDRFDNSKMIYDEERQKYNRDEPSDSRDKWENVTPDFTRKTECISYVRQDHLHTHDRQNESNTIAVIKRTRV
jgi:hypothetical protein